MTYARRKYRTEVLHPEVGRYEEIKPLPEVLKYPREKLAIEHVQLFEPVRGHTPHLRTYNKPYHDLKDEELKEAWSQYFRLHNIISATTKYGLKLSSALKQIAGPDYTKKLTKDDVDNVISNARKIMADMLLSDYFGFLRSGQEPSEELRKHIEDTFIGIESNIRKQFEVGNRVRHQDIDNLVEGVMRGVRERLAGPIYSELSHYEKRDVAGEVAALMYEFIGGPSYMARIEELERHKEASEVVQRALAPLEQEVATSYRERFLHEKPEEEREYAKELEEGLGLEEGEIEFKKEEEHGKDVIKKRLRKKGEKPERKWEDEKTFSKLK